MWTLQPPAVLLFSSISVRKQRSKQQTKKSSKSSPEVDLVEVNARLIYLIHTTWKDLWICFLSMCTVILVWLNELLHGVAQHVNLRDSLHNRSESHLVLLSERMVAIILRIGMTEKDLEKIQWGKILQK